MKKNITHWTFRKNSNNQIKTVSYCSRSNCHKVILLHCLHGFFYSVKFSTACENEAGCKLFYGWKRLEKKTVQKTLVMCVQLAKPAANYSDLCDLGSVPAGAFGRYPAQIALKLQGHLKYAHVQDLATSGGGGVYCKQRPVLHVSFHVFLIDANCGQMKMVICFKL